MNDIESLAKKCFEKEFEGEDDFGCLWAPAIVLLLTLVTVVVGEVSAGLGFGILLGGFVISIPVAIRAFLNCERKYIRGRMAAYSAGDPAHVQQVHDYAIRHFRQLVEKHRARTMGPESEWARARAPLAEAVDDANGSVAYWRERLKSDPENEACARQHRIVKGLEEKLRSALSKVDERADLLAKFYNDCEAKLAVMDQCRQDIQETRKVEELSSRADVVVAQAEGSIQALARAFVDEAQKIGRALGETAGAQYKVLAGEAPLDDIDYLADKIVECSDGEQARIKEMQNRLAE